MPVMPGAQYHSSTQSRLVNTDLRKVTYRVFVRSTVAISRVAAGTTLEVIETDSNYHLSTTWSIIVYYGSNSWKVARVRNATGSVTGQHHTPQGLGSFGTPKHLWVLASDSDMTPL